MINIVAKLRDGSAKTLSAMPSGSLMEAIRDAGVDELLALCGGCCSCATCHIHVDQNWITKLPKMSEDEAELLESSDHRNDLSRLSCQIPLRIELDGLIITIAEAD